MRGRSNRRHAQPLRAPPLSVGLNAVRRRIVGELVPIVRGVIDSRDEGHVVVDRAVGQSPPTMSEYPPVAGAVRKRAAESGETPACWRMSASAVMSDDDKLAAFRPP